MESKMENRTKHISGGIPLDVHMPSARAGSGIVSLFLLSLSFVHLIYACGLADEYGARGFYRFRGRHS